MPPRITEGDLLRSAAQESYGFPPARDMGRAIPLAEHTERRPARPSEGSGGRAALAAIIRILSTNSINQSFRINSNNSSANSNNCFSSSTLVGVNSNQVKFQHTIADQLSAIAAPIAGVKQLIGS